MKLIYRSAKDDDLEVSVKVTPRPWGYWGTCGKKAHQYLIRNDVSVYCKGPNDTVARFIGALIRVEEE